MNLCVITSLINISNLPLSYTNKRSIFNANQRLEQTLKSINTVREKITNCEIVLLEGSKLSDEFEEILISLVDYYVNYSNDEDICKNVDGIYKGAGECKILNKFMNEFDLSNYDNLFKLSGRYYINQNFNIELFICQKNVFGGYERVISTRLFKIYKTHFEEFKIALEKTYPIMLKGESIEYVLHKYISNKKYIKILGVEGNVAVDNTKVNE
jgi:hypothetical protein